MPKTKTKLLIATPTHRGLSTGYVVSLVNCIRELPRLGVEVTYGFEQDNSLIPRARALLASHFMSTDATHLLMVDDDISFDAATVKRMIDRDVDIVAGAVPLRRLAWDRAAAAARAGIDPQEQAVTFNIALKPVWESALPEEIVNGTVRVAFAGTAFVLCKRSVFERLYEKYEDLTFNTERDGGAGLSVDVFGPFIRNGIYLSEDLAFCQRWRDIGGEIWALLDADFGHAGTVEVRGNYMKTLKGLGAVSGEEVL